MLGGVWNEDDQVDVQMEADLIEAALVVLSRFLILRL